MGGSYSDYYLLLHETLFSPEGLGTWSTVYQCSVAGAMKIRVIEYQGDAHPPKLDMGDGPGYLDDSTPRRLVQPETIQSPKNFAPQEPPQHVIERS